MLKLKDELYNIISHHSGQTFDKVHADSERDYWMIAEEAKAYGMLDDVLIKPKKEETKQDVNIMQTFINNNIKLYDYQRRSIKWMYDTEIQQTNEINPLVYKETKELIKLPNNLNSIFTTITLCRTGVLTNVNVPPDVNITYISSIMTLLDQEYNDMKDTKQIKFIEVFIRKLYKEVKLQYTTFKYKDLGWNLKDFKNQFI